MKALLETVKGIALPKPTEAYFVGSWKVRLLHEPEFFRIETFEASGTWKVRIIPTGTTLTVILTLIAGDTFEGTWSLADHGTRIRKKLTRLTGMRVLAPVLASAMPLQRAIEYLFPDNDDDVELVIENKDRFRHEHKGKTLAIYERMVGSSHQTLL
jgi:hypothetical protein